MSRVTSDRSCPVNTQATDNVKPPGEAQPLDGISARPAVTFARRGDLEAFLISHGVARGAARRISAGGWPALRKQSPMEAAYADLLDTINTSPLGRFDA